MELSEITSTTFRTTREADDICDDLTQKLGWDHRYVAARLAIARSLSLPSPPPSLSETTSIEMALPIRGLQLFGEGVVQATWFALITQHEGGQGLTKKSLQSIVSAHWQRGATLLQKDYDSSEKDLAKFITKLAELADFVGEPHETNEQPSLYELIGSVKIPVGELSRDIQTEELVEFIPNGSGSSPHVAIMGGVGSGKTRTAIHILKSIRNIGNLPLLAFDFKGDLSAKLSEIFNAELLNPPVNPVPLDVLYTPENEETIIKTSAQRIRDSILSIKSSRHGGVQSNLLREAVVKTLKLGAVGSVTLTHVSNALEP